MFSNNVTPVFNIPNQELFSFNNFSQNTHTENSNSENSSFITNKSNIFSQNKSENSNIFSQNKSENSNIFSQNNIEGGNNKIDIIKYINQSNENDEINELKTMLNELKTEFKKEINILKNELNKNNNNGIYVKCSLHEHMLKEQTIYNLKGVYLNGFVCDNCGYKQQNMIEKFYNCSKCKCNFEGAHGGFDLCITCVKMSL